MNGNEDAFIRAMEKSDAVVDQKVFELKRRADELAEIATLDALDPLVSTSGALVAEVFVGMGASLSTSLEVGSALHLAVSLMLADAYLIGKNAGRREWVLENMRVADETNESD